jgi:SAM-dependent methyltransferase
MSIDTYIERYMREEYSTITSETEFVGKLLFDNVRGRVLDFGCGPSLLYWAMFMHSAESIDGFDILPENIEYLKRILSQPEKPAIYKKLADRLQNTLLKQNRKDLIKDCFAKINKLRSGDILKRIPFKKGYYDTVTEVGCIGCVNTEAELTKAVSNMRSHLKTGGTAVFVNWTDRKTPIAEEVPQFDGAVPVTKTLFAEAFAKAGFRDIKLAYKKNIPSSEFATILYGTAKKRS